MARAYHLALVALAFACGQASPPLGPPEGFCDRFAAASCESDARCSPGTMQSDLPSCVASVSATCQADLVSEAALRAWAAGKLAWRDGEATRCLEMLEGPCASRELRRRLRPDPCVRLWAGRVAPGRACEPPPDPGRLHGTHSAESRLLHPQEECAAGACECGKCPDALPSGAPCSLQTPPCAPGLVCKFRGDLGRQACSAMAREGEACEDGLECATGLCDGVTCVRESPAGGPCEYRKEALSITRFTATLERPCQPGLACLLEGESGPGVCGIPRGEGQPCRRIRECATGLTCLSSGSCGAFRGPGEPCSPPLAESDVSFTGVPFPPAGPVWSGEGGDCSAGLICIDGSCRTRPSGAGELCDACQGVGFACPAGPCFGPSLVCDTDGRCSVSAPAGRCASSAVCPEGYYCACGVAGLGPCPWVCEAKRGNGETCGDSLQCGSGTCGPTPDPVCIPPFQGSDGDSCTVDSQCLSGSCSPNSFTCRATCSSP